MRSNNNIVKYLINIEDETFFGNKLFKKNCILIQIWITKFTKKYIILMKHLAKIIGACLLFITLLVFSFSEIFKLINQYKGHKLWRQGQMYAICHDWKASIERYQQAILYLPECGELRFHIAGSFQKIGKLNEALIELEIAERTFNDKNIYLSRALIYEKLSNFEEAEKNYKIMLKMYPNLLMPKYLLAKLYYQFKYFEKATEILNSLLTIQPKIQNRETAIIRQAAKNLLMEIKGQ